MNVCEMFSLICMLICSNKRVLVVYLQLLFPFIEITDSQFLCKLEIIDSQLLVLVFAIVCRRWSLGVLVVTPHTLTLIAPYDPISVRIRSPTPASASQILAPATSRTLACLSA